MCTPKKGIIKTTVAPLDEIGIGGTGYFCFNYMKKYGANLAQIDVTTGKEETYDMFLQKCIRTSIVLKSMNIKKGDVVAFCSETDLNSCVPLIACFFIGAVPLYVDTTFPMPEVIHFVNSISPKMFLVTLSFLKIVQRLTDEASNPAEVVLFNEDFFKPQAEEISFAPVYVKDLRETAVIHFSSGSTGLPKGICMNHNVLVRNGMVDDLLGGQVVLSYDSFHWCAETFRLMRSVFVGACRLISSEAEYWKTIWHTVHKYKVNVMYLSPWDIIKALESDKPKDASLNTLSTIYVEGSLLPAMYLKRLQNLLPGVDIFHTYGQTETGRLTSFKKTDLHREYIRRNPECIGIPLGGLGISLKVVNSETGEVLGPNQRGELRVKGPTVMNGYFNLDSSGEFDEDKWLKTGDIVYYDENMCFFFVGRNKDFILFQGWHVVPAIIEMELFSHPAVRYAVVIGVPHEEDTERAMALVVLNDDFSATTESEIERYIETRVPARYHLWGGVKFMDGSCLSGNKIKRSKLKELVLSGKC